MKKRNLICIIPIGNIGSGIEIKSMVGLPIVLTSEINFPKVSIFEINEERYVLSQKYKIGLKNLNPYFDQDETFYQSDLRQILMHLEESSDAWFNTLFGFYTRVPLKKITSLSEGDLILRTITLENGSQYTTHCSDVIKIEHVYRNKLMQFLFGNYRITSFIGKIKTSNVKDLNGKLTGLENETITDCSFYKLIPVSVDGVLK